MLEFGKGRGSGRHEMRIGGTRLYFIKCVEYETCAGRSDLVLQRCGGSRRYKNWYTRRQDGIETDLVVHMLKLRHNLAGLTGDLVGVLAADNR